MSKRWKDLERTVAKALGGRRIVREDFFESAPDVVVDDFRIVCECKAHKRFSHHSLLDKSRDKYCRPGEVPALATKAEGQRGAYITVPLEWLAAILNRVRQMRDGKREDANV